MKDLLQIDPIELEVGYALIPLVDERQGGDLLERISLLRKQSALELGILIPPWGVLLAPPLLAVIYAFRRPGK